MIHTELSLFTLLRSVLKVEKVWLKRGEILYRLKILSKSWNIRSRM
jgi:hypothetical protein